MWVRSKICGITRIEDGLAAARLGADAIGLVFYDKSPRAVSLEQAKQIAQQMPAFVTIVGLFVNASAAQVQHAYDYVGLDLIQYHGDESAHFCEMLGLPYIRALRMNPELNIAELAKGYTHAKGILLDTWVAGTPGGTGEVFNWQLIPELNKPVILAGGLTPDNIAQAVHQVAPWAVDVSGGVELAKGIKCASKIAQFMRALRTATNCTM